MIEPVNRDIAQLSAGFTQKEVHDAVMQMVKPKHLD
jgi:hypothetical protein